MSAALAMLVTLLATRLPASAQEQGPQEGALGYRIGPEDMLQVSVWNSEALSRVVRVRPDGMISLPLLNDVRAAGRTPLELRETLLRKLRDYIPSPQVSVIVTEVRSEGASRVVVIQ